MSHFKYDRILFDHYCKLASDTIDITLKPKFEVLIEYPENPEKEPEKQQIVLISSEEIIIVQIENDVEKRIYCGIDKNESLREIPGIHRGCPGYTEKIMGGGEYFKVTGDLFIQEPERILAPDYIVFTWEVFRQHKTIN
jgi:hypothetical protein